MKMRKQGHMDDCNHMHTKAKQHDMFRFEATGKLPNVTSEILEK